MDRDTSSVDAEITYLPAKNNSNNNNKKRTAAKTSGLSSWSSDPNIATSSPSNLDDSWTWTSRRYPFSRTMEELEEDLARERRIRNM